MLRINNILFGVREAPQLATSLSVPIQAPSEDDHGAQ